MKSLTLVAALIVSSASFASEVCTIMRGSYDNPRLTCTDPNFHITLPTFSGQTGVEWQRYETTVIKAFESFSYELRTETDGEIIFIKK